MVELTPFEGVGNRTSIVILQKGKETKYPVPYNYWVKKVKGIGLKDDLCFEEVTELATFKKFYAEPVDENDPTSPWITGRPGAIKSVKKVLGKSDYTAHAGAYSGGANAVFWVEIVDKRPDGLVIISNITEGAKKEVESIQTAIEPDLLYPLLRGRDVKKWKAESSSFIIITHLPRMRLNAIPEKEMKTMYPKTYIYLKRFEKILRERAAFIRYFTRKDNKGNFFETGPFYSMFDVGDYTFAPYKVVWPWISISVFCAVVSNLESKPIFPEHHTSFVSFNSEIDAHFFCAMLNSTVSDFTIRAFYGGGGGGIASPRVLEHICMPKFDSKNKFHLHLAELSKEAHELAKTEDKEKLREIEEELDEISAQIWGLTKDELKEIKLSLEELRG